MYICVHVLYESRSWNNSTRDGAVRIPVVRRRFGVRSRYSRAAEVDDPNAEPTPAAEITIVVRVQYVAPIECVNRVKRPPKKQSFFVV